MKKTLIAAALMVCAGSAFADPTAVLQVQGKLTNASCTPELSNGGVVDYGYIHLSALSSTDTNQLQNTNIDLIINCTAQTKVAWSTMDDRAGTIPSPGLAVRTKAGSTGTEVGSTYWLFGLGTTTNNVKIGNYIIDAGFKDNAPASIIADGNEVITIYRNSDWGDSSWSLTSSLRSDGYTHMSIANPGTLEPIAFSSVTIPLIIRTSIADTSTLAITDDTPIDGQATITLQYL
ncbi:DUF1120 domain-containing protein [Citrobacter freundii]|uniref:DUF1120 domain-containing protein n=1 Tax=Citrobacter freundii TaxID=546 RepID=A0A7W3D8X8_CITFR|nr:DUF1120 domain-containing protein [Citrobacter freundii]MBA8065175.1 DUF1120 domain-containing protein [Citrobacter freundii]